MLLPFCNSARPAPSALLPLLLALTAACAPSYQITVICPAPVTSQEPDLEQPVGQGGQSDVRGGQSAVEVVPVEALAAIAVLAATDQVRGVVGGQEARSARPVLLAAELDLEREGEGR
jgi:hypothetical protein